MLSVYYRGYEIQACTHGGHHIYQNGKPTHAVVDTVKEAKGVIDSWIYQEAYERDCESMEARRHEARHY